MEWTEVGGALDIKKEAVDTFHIGTYESSKPIKTPLGENIIYNFEGEDGVPFSIYGFTMLHQRMANIKPGSLCKITYRGKVKNNKGQDMHKVRVEVGREPAAVAGPADVEVPF